MNLTIKSFLLIIFFNNIYFPYIVSSSSDQFDSLPSILTDQQVFEEAINLDIATIDSKEPNNIDELTTNAFDYVTKGDYKGAVEQCIAILKQFPNSFLAQAYFAMIFGDYSNHFPNSERDRIIEKVKNIYSRLIEQVDKQTRTTYYWFMNEYNYRFKKFKDQYDLGLNRIKEFWGTENFTPSGYYSQGVGAANYARELLLQGEKDLALYYAQRSIVAWAQYFSYKNTYYNAYVHFAMALTILGYKNDALKTLEHAANIIQKDHVEFQEIKDFISEVESKGLVCFKS